MKQTYLRRILALCMALCLLTLPVLTQAETYLPDGDVTHVDFTLGASLMPDGFLQTKAHLSDWETFLKKLDIKGSMDYLAMFTPTSRVYLDAAIRLNGKPQVPFVYDGYHSYRYLITPALNNEVLYFQMHNFLEFMLKPYYYMELPTQYLALLMYPEASYYMGDSYFTPTVETLAAAREAAVAAGDAERQAVIDRLTQAKAALEQQQAEIVAGKDALTQTLNVTATPMPVAEAAGSDAAAATEPSATADATAAPDANAATAATAAPDASADASATATAAPDANAATDTTASTEATAAPAPAAGQLSGADTQAALAALDEDIVKRDEIIQTLGKALESADTASMADLYAAQAAVPEDILAQLGEPDTTAESAPPMVVNDDGTTSYRVPYENLYELCETLDLTVNDDPELERAYFYFTCLLTELYASDMTLDILGRLEDVLDYLDPDQNGLLVTEGQDSLTCELGGTEVYRSQTENGVTTISFRLPTPEGFDFVFDYRWDPAGSGAKLDATAAIEMEGANAAMLKVSGEGLPREGDISGKGQITFSAGSDSDAEAPVPVTLQFDWVRDAAQLPYTLDLTLTWLHPATAKPAIALHFNGTFSAEDKSVFVDASYPQSDFFNLNESFLNEYKDRMLKPLMLKLAPILLETPAGVINDVYAFAQESDILVSLVE